MSVLKRLYGDFILVAIGNSWNFFLHLKCIKYNRLKRLLLLSRGKAGKGMHLEDILF